MVSLPIFRHLPLLEVFGFIVVRSHFEEPFVLDWDDLPHVFFRREDKVVVDDPFGQFLEHTRSGMYQHGLLFFHGFVVTGLRESDGVVEIPRGDRFSDGNRIPIA